MTKCIVGKCLLLTILNKRGMSQVDLSIKTGISKTQINEYINGTRKMSLANAKLIAHVLRCHIDDLYQWSIKEE
jgi:putative transcriptional regulator